LHESLRFANVRTYVQSGNVVFDSTRRDATQLAASIEAQIERSFGYAVSVFIRDTDDLRRIISGNPFLSEKDPAKLYVTFLYRSPSRSTLSNLDISSDEADEFFIKGKEIFLFCPNGYGRTKLSNNFFERKLNMPATTRNWKTVTALYGMASER
jgi:uncharacterized protein (DUF1697 family)